MGSWARLGRKFLLGEFKWRICLESASKLQSKIAEAGVLTWAGRWERISRVRSFWLQRSAPQLCTAIQSSQGRFGVRGEKATGQRWRICVSIQGWGLLVHFGEGGAVSSKHQPKSSWWWRGSEGCQLRLQTEGAGGEPRTVSSCWDQRQECKEL